MGFLEESELRRESSPVPQFLSSAAGDRTDGKRREGLQQKTLAGRQFGGRRRRGLYQIFGVIARKLSLFSFYWGLDLYEIMRAGREAGPHRPLVTLDTRASNEPSRRLKFHNHGEGFNNPQ